MKKRILAFLTAGCLICSMVPFSAFAENPTDELIQLATPTDLVWNQRYNDDGTLSPSWLGTIAYKVNTPCQYLFRECIYRVGETEPVYNWGHSGDPSNNHNRNHGLLFEDLESGTYYFTVQALGDGTQYANSEISAPSDYWEYVKPEAKLKTPLNPEWDGATAIWAEQDDTEFFWSYSAEVFFAKTKDEEPERAKGNSYLQTVWWEGQPYGTLKESTVQANGDGYYYFRVRTHSNNLTEYCHSDWSELSPAYHLTSIPTQDGLYNILNDTEIFTPEEIRQAVYDLNTGDLKNALLADQNEPGGTAELLARLEEKTGVAVSTTAEKPEFEEMAAETQIIGAALNDVPDGTDSVTLNIGSPEKEHVIPEQYHNTVALQFSMGLEGVTNQEDLKVPVRVTLPIPSTINPAFLVLLHYGQDGSVEAIEQPYKFQKDGKWYVSIVLTHFSDFVMTEEKQSEPEPTPTPIPDSGGSSSSSDDAPTYAITLPKDIEGGSVSVSPKRAEKGDKVTLTATPEAGHRVKKVTVTDKKGAEIELTRQENGTYTFLMPGGPITVSAQFVTRSVEVIPPPPFADVSDTEEEQAAITYVYDKGLMNGTSDTTFEPETETSRAMLITILHRLDGQPAPENRSDFADVPAGEWYSDAVGWAVEKGIVVGFEDNTFRPEELLTKEHLTTILYRYADYKGYDVTQREALSDYIDRDAVSAYAVEAIGWAKAKGLLNMEERMLLPGERVRRRRVADMVMQFCENVIE